MRNKLIKILCVPICPRIGADPAEVVADYLLDNGIVAAPQWISVEERLPEDDNRVLVSCRTKKGVQSCNLAYYWNGTWHGQGSMAGVTHWMPLPEPPEAIERKEQKNNGV